MIIPSDQRIRFVGHVVALSVLPRLRSIAADPAGFRRLDARKARTDSRIRHLLWGLSGRIAIRPR
jgi:hypothetical protein